MARIVTKEKADKYLAGFTFYGLLWLHRADEQLCMELIQHQHEQERERMRI